MISNKNQIDQYIKDIESGKIIACKWVRLAIKRHQEDLKQGHKRGLYFDEDSADRIINFFKNLRFTKGKYAKEPFDLEPFQKFRYWVLFGWKREDGTRRFRKCYIEGARKFGKTEEGGALCNYMLIADGEYGAEIYTAATKKDQAKITFKAAKVMAEGLRRDSKKANTRLGTSVNTIYDLETNSNIEPLASDSDKQDGLNPHLGIIDEYHAHRNSDLLEVIETAMGAREQPLLFVITTAGFNKQGPCFQLRKVITEILEGKKTDDSTFGIIYTLDEEDDWEDENTWIKSNPNIGRTPTWNYMRDQYRKAKNEGATKEVQFKTKNLNIWTDSSMAWINDKDWMKCDKGKLPNLTGKKCYGGLDLASVSDFNSLTLNFPPQDGLEERCFLYFFWIPGETARKKSDKADYLQWITDGYVKKTEGNVIDHRVIIKDISDLLTKYQVQSICFDRFLAYHGVVQELSDSYENMVEFGQGFLSMSEPTKDFQKMIKGEEFNHAGNPVMRWMMGNIEIKIDPADNIKIDKGKSQEKVDGPVSSVMSIGAENLTPEKVTSIYETDAKI